MAKKQCVLFGILVLLIAVTAAPSDISETDDVIQADKTETIEPNIEASDGNLSQGSKRQKRFYNYYGYGFPPISPVIYSDSPRGYSSGLGPNVNEDPLVEIHKRLKEIVDVVKQPAPPPSTPFPFLFPVIFVPQYDCNCFHSSAINPPTEPTAKKNETLPSVENRVPVLLDDERQNWGLVVNESENDDYEDDLTNRPISFDPIKAGRPMARPPPPVEHGSKQSETGNLFTTTTTTTTAAPAVVTSLETFGFQSQIPKAPSICEKAVLSCCHQVHVTYDCFVSQGCPSIASVSNGKPCDPKVILQVIDRFQKYYGQRNGI